MGVKNRHSFVAFYPSDWMAGTHRMTRLVKSVYHDICLYNWDRNEPVSEAEQMLMFADLEAQGPAIINALVATGKLHRQSNGSIFCERAMGEAGKAYELWAKKSAGGRKGSSVTNAKTVGDTVVDDKNHLLTPIHPLPIRETSSPLSVEPDDATMEDPQVAIEEASATEQGSLIRQVHAIAERWNEMAMANGLGQIIKMTDKRKTAAKARLSEFSVEQISEAISLIPKRPFLMGKGSSGWKANFDFLMQPNSVAKILEGVAYMGGTSAGSWTDA